MARHTTTKNLFILKTSISIDQSEDTAYKFEDNDRGGDWTIPWAGYTEDVMPYVFKPQNLSLGQGSVVSATSSLTANVTFTGDVFEFENMTDY